MQRLNQWLNGFCLLATLFVFVYLIFRAIYVPPYSDEVFTFFMYIQPGDFLPFKAQTDANNHFLNSFLGYISYTFFGSSMLALRLPNVLAFLVYAYYCFKIKEQFNSPIIGFCWFITLISAHYFITFFHLARGYGLSMAFFTAAIYYLILFKRTFKNPFSHASTTHQHDSRAEANGFFGSSLNNFSKHKTLYTGLAFCSLALWANLTLMVPVLVVGSTFLILFYLKNKIKGFKNHWTVFWPILVTFILPLFYAVKYTLLLKDKGLLYHGKGKTFIEAIVNGLTEEFAKPYVVDNRWAGLLLAFYVLGMATALIKNRKSISHYYLHLILLVTVLGTLGLSYFLGVNYPKDRAAIYFFVLFMAALFFALDESRVKLYVVFAAIPAVAFSAHLLLTLNLTHTSHWKSEAVPRSFYKYMVDWQAKTGQVPTISCHGLLGRVLTYYDFKNGGTLNTPQESGFPSSLTDFVVLNDWNGEQQMAGYDTVIYDSVTRITLLKREQPYVWQAVDSLQMNHINSKEGGIQLIKIPADSFVNRPFCFDIEFTAQAKRNPMKWWLVFAAQDSLGDWQSFNQVELYTVKADLRKGGTIKRRQYIQAIPASAKVVNIHFWNMDKKDVNIQNLKLKLYRGNKQD